MKTGNDVMTKFLFSDNNNINMAVMRTSQIRWQFRHVRRNVDSY